jgi:hypothetical protein
MEFRKVSKKKIIEYSKLWITLWQLFCMIWISIYLISDIKQNRGLNSEQVVLSLIASIVAVFIPYLVKAFLGKLNEEKTRLIEKELDGNVDESVKSSGMEDE